MASSGALGENRGSSRAVGHGRQRGKGREAARWWEEDACCWGRADAATSAEAKSQAVRDGNTSAFIESVVAVIQSLSLIKIFATLWTAASQLPSTVFEEFAQTHVH